MELRKNRFIKSFFVVLFLLGFLSPAFPAQAEFHLEGSHYEINRPNHLNILINLFSEQLNENEEGREDDKSTLLFCEAHPGYSLRPEFNLNSGKPSDSGIDKTCHPYSCPSLFMIYGEYLI